MDGLRCVISIGHLSCTHTHTHTQRDRAYSPQQSKAKQNILRFFTLAVVHLNTWQKNKQTRFLMQCNESSSTQRRKRSSSLLIDSIDNSLFARKHPSGVQSQHAALNTTSPIPLHQYGEAAITLSDSTPTLGDNGFSSSPQTPPDTEGDTNRNDDRKMTTRSRQHVNAHLSRKDLPSSLRDNNNSSTNQTEADYDRDGDGGPHTCKEVGRGEEEEGLPRRSPRRPQRLAQTEAKLVCDTVEGAHTYNTIADPLRSPPFPHVSSSYSAALREKEPTSTIVTNRLESIVTTLTSQVQQQSEAILALRKENKILTDRLEGYLSVAAAVRAASAEKEASLARTDERRAANEDAKGIVLELSSKWASEVIAEGKRREERLEARLLGVTTDQFRAVQSKVVEIETNANSDLTGTQRQLLRLARQTGNANSSALADVSKRRLLSPFFSCWLRCARGKVVAKSAAYSMASASAFVLLKRFFKQWGTFLVTQKRHRSEVAKLQKSRTIALLGFSFSLWRQLAQSQKVRRVSRLTHLGGASHEAHAIYCRAREAARSDIFDTWRAWAASRMRRRVVIKLAETLEQRTQIDQYRILFVKWVSRTKHTLWLRERLHQLRRRNLASIATDAFRKWARFAHKSALHGAVERTAAPLRRQIVTLTNEVSELRFLFFGLVERFEGLEGAVETLARTKLSAKAVKPSALVSSTPFIVEGKRDAPRTALVLEPPDEPPSGVSTHAREGVRKDSLPLDVSVSPLRDDDHDDAIGTAVGAPKGSMGGNEPLVVGVRSGPPTVPRGGFTRLTQREGFPSGFLESSASSARSLRLSNTVEERSKGSAEGAARPNVHVLDHRSGLDHSARISSSPTSIVGASTPPRRGDKSGAVYGGRGGVRDVEGASADQPTDVNGRLSGRRLNEHKHF